jgi:sugar/nucleoside kinase (ribokinase family)
MENGEKAPYFSRVMTPRITARSGLLAGGNFIVDHVKIIDSYPAQDMLASIVSQSQSNGGGPYNVLRDLVALEAGFPLAAVGMVGDDENGRWIQDDLAGRGIDTAQLHRTPQRPTSYTDAMTVAATGRRTFFHQRGANALLDVEHFDFSTTTAKHFHLAYLMLLDRLDTLDERHQSRAARVLAAARAAGLETSVDMVSTEHPQFSEIALSALPHTDHLMINEIETSRVLRRTVAADDVSALTIAAEELLAAGVHQTVTLHTEHGAVGVSRQWAPCFQGSVCLPDGFSRGATGAGDAFAAGLLLGLHRGTTHAESLRCAVCAAALSLADPTPSGGVQPLGVGLALAERFGFRAFGPCRSEA